MDNSEDNKKEENKVIATGVIDAWYNERCHIVPDGNINRWRCTNCKLIHFFCTRCHTFKTIPDEWEPTSIYALNGRMRVANHLGWYCDPCWFAYRETIRVVDEPEHKIYV